MERPSDKSFDIPVVEEADAWIRYLESNGAVTPLGEPHDPCKVIALSERLWGLGRLVERSSGGQSTTGPTNNSTDQRVLSHNHPLSSSKN